MKRPGILLLHTLIMFGYSAVFISIAAFAEVEMIAPHWGVLLLHMLGLFITGLVKLLTPETKKAGGQYLLAGLVVAIIGHGLCFFGGLLNFNVH